MGGIIWLIIIFISLGTVPFLTPILLVFMVIERFEAKKRSRERRKEKIQEAQLRELLELKEIMSKRGV